MKIERKQCARKKCDNWFTPHANDDNKKYCSEFCRHRQNVLNAKVRKGIYTGYKDKVNKL